MLVELRHGGVASAARGANLVDGLLRLGDAEDSEDVADLLLDFKDFGLAHLSLLGYLLLVPLQRVLDLLPVH